MNLLLVPCSSEFTVPVVLGMATLVFTVGMVAGLFIARLPGTLERLSGHHGGKGGY